ncbi:MAG: helix-turn-helix transcriptional regulator [Clostridia bacterium]|nr:helix-turn-helix transcriptional regulator [Clostridia bacterium]
MSFSQNLKLLRKTQKINQKKLAKIIDVSPKTVSHWETGYTEPSINQLISLANFFDITIDELVDRK